MSHKPISLEEIANSFAGYHAFTSEEGDLYGSFEIFWHNRGDYPDNREPGWYWWPCFPGCIPDGEATGPFHSSYLALVDAVDIEEERRKDHD